MPVSYQGSASTSLQLSSKATASGATPGQSGPLEGTPREEEAHTGRSRTEGEESSSGGDVVASSGTKDGSSGVITVDGLGKGEEEERGKKRPSDAPLPASQVSAKFPVRTSIALSDPSCQSGVGTPGGGKRSSQRQLVLSITQGDAKGNKALPAPTTALEASGTKPGGRGRGLTERPQQSEGKKGCLRPASAATNTVAVDFLRRLPGVHSKNISLIVSRVREVSAPKCPRAEVETVFPPLYLGEGQTCLPRRCCIGERDIERQGRKFVFGGGCEKAFKNSLKMQLPAVGEDRK